MISTFSFLAVSYDSEAIIHCPILLPKMNSPRVEIRIDAEERDST